MILHTPLQWLRQNIHQCFSPQNSGRAMGCLLWGFWKKIDPLIMALHCIIIICHLWCLVLWMFPVLFMLSNFYFYFSFFVAFLFLYIWYMFMIVFCCEQLNAWHAVFHRNKTFCEIWKLVPCLQVTSISLLLCVQFKIKRIYLKCIWLLNFKQCKLLKFSLK